MPISPDTLLDEAKCLGCNSSATLSEMLKLALLQRIAESAQSGADGNPSLPLNSVQFNDGGALGGDADFTWNKTTNDLSVAGSVIVPLIVGGTATTQDLTFKTTSGIGAAGADMHFQVGNNGATEAMTILNSGFVGIRTTSPGAVLDVRGPAYIGTGQGLYLTDSVIQDGSGADLDIRTTSGNRNILIRPNGTGNVGIGTTGPTAALHIKAGTIAASTAPLKFTSGPLLTAAEAGAVEFLTDKFYGTITTGAERRTFATLEGAQTFTGLFTLPGGANLVATSAAMTSGAGAGAGTITNAPTAGNPAVWCPILLNGVPHWFPCWT